MFNFRIVLDLQKNCEDGTQSIPQYPTLKYLSVNLFHLAWFICHN